MGKRKRTVPVQPQAEREDLIPVDEIYSTEAQDPPPEHARFTEWALEKGVVINGVEPKAITGRGIGLITTKRLKKDDRILFIPAKAIFTPSAKLLKAERLKNISPQAQLVLSALHAFEQPDSDYQAWRATWPTIDQMEQYMPMCWPKTVQDLLPLTTERPLARQLADFNRDRDASREVCNTRNWSARLFRYYWMIVNSRSFHWSVKRSLPDDMAMCPFIDYMNHGPTGTGCKVLQAPDGYHVVADRDYGLAISCLPVSAPLTELLATYGAHSNDKLLVHYGFIPFHQPNTTKDASPEQIKTEVDDSISLDHLIIPGLSPSTQIQLRDLGYLGGYTLSVRPALDLQEALLEPKPPELCFKTQVAARAALGVTCNQWEYFAGSGGDDLGVDLKREVNLFVAEALRRFVDLGVQQLASNRETQDENSETKKNPESKKECLDDELGNYEQALSTELALQMIMQRWSQLKTASLRFDEAVGCS